MKIKKAIKLVDSKIKAKLDKKIVFWFYTPKKTQHRILCFTHAW